MKKRKRKSRKRYNKNEGKRNGRKSKSLPKNVFGRKSFEALFSGFLWPTVHKSTSLPTGRVPPSLRDPEAVTGAY